MVINLQNSGVVYDAKMHSYMFRGLPLFGITTFIDAVLCEGDPDKWGYVNIPEHILRAAAKRGREVHQDIEMMLKGYDMDTIECKLAKELLPKKQKYECEYIVTDKTMFASPIDIVGKCGKSFTLYDIKTNSKLDDSCMLRYTWQLNIYKYLFERQTKGYVTDLKILWINKKLEHELKDIEFIDDSKIYDFLYSCESWEFYQKFINK